MPTPPRRRWFQFGLRTLFVVVTMAAVWLGWWTNSARRQKLAVEALKRLDPECAVYYDYQAGPNGPGHAFEYDDNLESGVPRMLLSALGRDFFHRVTTVRVNECNDEVLSNLGQLRNLKSIVFMLEPSAAAIRSLEELPQLEEVFLGPVIEFDLPGLEALGRFLSWLFGSQPQEQPPPTSPQPAASLKELPVLPRLTRLYSGLSNDDASAEHVARFPRLEMFGSGHDTYSDEGLRRIATLRRLKMLDIEGPGVTDAGLKLLLDLKDLEGLSLRESHVTVDGLAMLQALPKLNELVVPKRMKQDLPALRAALPNCSISTN